MEVSRSVLLGSGKVESRLGKKLSLSSESSVMAEPTEKPTEVAQCNRLRKLSLSEKPIESVCVHVVADQGRYLEPSTRHPYHAGALLAKAGQPIWVVVF